MSNERSQITGILWMLFHCLLISIMSAMVREISSQFHVFEIVFFYNFSAFMLILPFALISETSAMLDAVPPTWNVRSVSCVPGSPMD